MAQAAEDILSCVDQLLEEAGDRGLLQFIGQLAAIQRDGSQIQALLGEKSDPAEIRPLVTAVSGHVVELSSHALEYPDLPTSVEPIRYAAYYLLGLLED